MGIGAHLGWHPNLNWEDQKRALTLLLQIALIIWDDGFNIEQQTQKDISAKREGKVPTLFCVKEDVIDSCDANENGLILCNEKDNVDIFKLLLMQAVSK